MPPKPKFTEKEMLDAGIPLVREGGVEALTARNIARILNSSSRPIFTLYNIKLLNQTHAKASTHQKEIPRKKKR